MAHDTSGHQGTDKTLARLSDFTYWVGMARDVGNYCTCCVTCQMAKAPAAPPASLQPIVTSRPWELVAVDILKVPTSNRGNSYLLVAQDYFSKWPFAMALPDQKATTIVRALRDQVFTMVGPPKRLHSDQGRNFESYLLSELCKAFGVEKSRTTPYHPMGDGLVERMNRSLLNLLRTLMEKRSNWEDHLQLLLFAYRTTQHSTTKLSPYEVLFGQNPPLLQLPSPLSSTSPDPSDYSSQLKRKLEEMREMVEANLTESAETQRKSYRGQNQANFVAGQRVFLDDPTRGKLDPRWTGPWEVICVKGPLTLELKMGSSRRVVHVNRVRPILAGHADTSASCGSWSPPLFTHHDSVVESRSSQENQQVQDPQNDDDSVRPQHTVTRSGRIVRPPDYYGITGNS